MKAVVTLTDMILYRETDCTCEDWREITLISLTAPLVFWMLLHFTIHQWYATDRGCLVIIDP